MVQGVPIQIFRKICIKNWQLQYVIDIFFLHKNVQLYKLHFKNEIYDDL